MAVVLAAGMGTRLQSVHAGQPKGFVDVAGQPIIARSLRTLQAAGIEDFVFVVGWQAERYADWLQEVCPAARVVMNAAYATTGSLRSLRLGAAAVPGRDILVVESDLLYEARALTPLLASGAADTVLMSGFTGSGDEVWIYADERGCLASMSKVRRPEAAPVGELVGLSRFSASLIAALERAGADLPASAHYEDGLNAVAPQRPIALAHLPDLAWCEIDDTQHLRRARELIWPRILHAEARPVV